MERDDKRTINWLVRWLSVIWLAGTSLGALRLFAAIFEKYPILGSLLSCGWVIAAVLAICHVFDQTRNESSDAEGTNQNSETENGASLSAANAVKPIVKAVVKAKAVAPYQTKMCGLAKQFEDYDAELRNLGKETGNYKKAMAIIKKEFNRQCDYVARIAEIEGKQGDMSGNEKTVEISKKVRKSYKAHRDEATKSIESLIGNAEQVVVLMVKEFQQNNHDARIAILNYAEPEIENYDIDAIDIKRNQGDIGEFYGKLRVESEMLRFTADRDDGEVHLTQIALLGESMEDPRTFGFTDNMMAKVVAEVDRGINEFERQEEIDKALGGTEHDADERSADEPER